MHILLCITNNSIKHWLFVYIQLNDQTVLFLTIQSCISHLFPLCLNSQTFLFNLEIESYQVLLLQVRVDLGAIVMKEYSTFPNSPSLTIRLFNVISETLLPLYWVAVSIFYSFNAAEVCNKQYLIIFALII